jgi:LytS/YehU family sensor histidine kinase
MVSPGLRRPFGAEVIYVTLYVISVILILECGRFIILKVHKKSEFNTRNRFKKAFTSVLIANFFLIVATFYLSHWIRGMMYAEHDFSFFLAMFIVSGVLAMAQVGIYEGFYYFTRLRRVEQEKEELMRINLQSHFDSLKQQVNPHFLFNSINTVSSLIDKDPIKAKKYLAEMSKVYRYLLRTNEEELTTLQTELLFAESYFHLLKTRFGDGLHLNCTVADSFRNCRLPALTLQLLLENAVKHNTIDKSKPLSICITTTENGWLSIRNNVQKRMNVLPSTKIGLANIMAKYKLLNQPDVRIEAAEKEFTILLPLIKNNE